MACFGPGDVEIPCDQWYADKAAGLHGQQTGSQFWMDTAYVQQGYQEPPLAVKAQYSTADYARDWIQNYAASIPATVTVSPAVQAIQKYPTTQTSVSAPVQSANALDDALAQAGSFLSNINPQYLLWGAVALVAILVLPGLFASGRGARG